ncbi:hypothetical protein JMUB3935_0719 [Leptotrichia trevisanii]|uniref:Uncharacterized protein n=1 Tax=Leptotrichia trevisanii TaxID=109328 RepID=A0A510KM90_9FUSO|nr:hypothetical protein [Leptotrichia trevisanii]BBM51741.1 hypothetical protein JMUB3935_0719 [Leptotrichia trevisanii]
MSVESNNNENGQQQSGEKLLKKIKKVIDSLGSFNSSVISILGLGIVGIANWFLKLHYSQVSESFYEIDEKYFFSYNYRKAFYILMFWILISSIYFLITEIYIKKNRDEEKWIREVFFLGNICLQTYLIYLPSYTLSLLFNFNILLKIIIFSILLILVIVYNKQEYSQKRTGGFLLIFIIYYCLTYFIIAYRISNFKNYELTTIESKDKVSKKVVVLSEYQGKYLVVPYLKKNEVLEMQENKLVYNINEKKSTCKKEYCFFTGSYEFIDKFDYIFKTERINEENIRIVKEELEYISQNQKKDGTTEIEENKDNKDIKNKPSENEEKDTTICFIIDKNCKIKCCNKNKK